MYLYDNRKYLEDIEYVSNLDFPWDRLRNNTILVSGATGLLGSFLVDVIMKQNEKGLNCTIIAIARNVNNANSRFKEYLSNPLFQIIIQDVKAPIVIDTINQVEYIFHFASNTHPVQYSSDPIGTIETNILGLKNLLDFSLLHNTRRFVFASSNEIYGENRGDVELFGEDYCGYINSNTLRAGYPESKRCGEALCQAYISQKDLDIVIPRFTRSYGPTMKMDDTKALSQFIKNYLADEDIVLKSAGTQYYSYQYMADSISGLLYVLFYGVSGEAYNIANADSDIMLKDLASFISSLKNRNVIYDLPNDIESRGFSTATKARLNGNKLNALGWHPKYDIRTGIKRTLSILDELES